VETPTIVFYVNNGMKELLLLTAFTSGTVMRRPSEQKECPRCKIKNRQGAYQCDFCGWDFRTASDEWMGKVGDLEKLSKSVETPVPDLDRHTAARVEMTIKRPLDIKVPEPQPADEPEMVQEPEEEAETIEEPIFEEPEDVQDIPAEAPEAAEDEIEPESAHEMAEPVLEPAEEEAAIEAVAPIMQPTKVELERKASFTLAKEGPFANPLVIPVGLIIAGIVIYITALAVAPGLGKAVGWSLAIVGAALITLAVQRFIMIRRNGPDGEEIVLCPNCHEVVTDHAPGCPSCGARFTKPIAKE